jgi:drug/metabolite transporter (DMT)-like permease
LLALILCLASAACYNGGIVLQSAGAFGSNSERVLRPSLFGQLVRVRSWVVGTALSLVGWGFQVWALTAASLTFVQPALGTGVFFLLAFAWLVLGQRPNRRDAAGALALAAGIGLLSLYAPAPGDATSGAGTWLAVGAVLAAASLAPFALRAAGRVAGPLWLAASVGFAYALTGLSSEVVSRGIERGDLAMFAGGAAVTACFGVTGFLTETSALLSGSVTAVVPVMVAVDTVLPVALAPMLFGERWPHSAPRIVALCVGLVGAVGGAITLAGSPRVARSRFGPHPNAPGPGDAAATKASERDR